MKNNTPLMNPRSVSAGICCHYCALVVVLFTHSIAVTVQSVQLLMSSWMSALRYSSNISCDTSIGSIVRQTIVKAMIKEFLFAGGVRRHYSATTYLSTNVADTLNVNRIQ